jgi:hypothetical protein
MEAKASYFVHFLRSVPVLFDGDGQNLDPKIFAFACLFVCSGSRFSFSKPGSFTSLRRFFSKKVDNTCQNFEKLLKDVQQN